MARRNNRTKYFLAFIDASTFFFFFFNLKAIPSQQSIYFFNFLKDFHIKTVHLVTRLDVVVTNSKATCVLHFLLSDTYQIKYNAVLSNFDV